MEVISSKRRDLFHFRVTWIRQQQCKCGWKSMLCMNSGALAAPWQPSGLNVSPSILPCDGVTIGWAVDETDVDSNQRRSVRGHHLSADHTSVSVHRQKKKKMSRYKEIFRFVSAAKALKIKYCTHLSNSHNGTSQLPSVSRRVFYWEWADNEIKKLHFAFALIKKEGLSFPLRDTRDQNNKAANRKACLGGFQDAGRFPRSHQAFRIYIN